MTLFRLPAGAVLLDGSDVDAIAQALRDARRWRQRNGLPPVRAWERLGALLAAPGHADTPTEPAGQPESMTTREAAQLLQCSERTARRLAPRLGGQNIGGRWLLDRLAVLDHIEGDAHHEDF